VDFSLAGLRITKIVRYTFFITVWALPLVIYNRMMWDFYVPKELFFRVALFSALFIHFLRRRTGVEFGLPDVIVIGCLFFIMVPSVIDGRITPDGFRTVCYLVLFYVLVQNTGFTGVEDLSRFTFCALTGLFCVGVVEAIYSLLQFFRLDLLHPHGIVTFGPRVVGTLGHANLLGGYLAMVFPCGVAVWKYCRGTRWRALVACGLGVMIVALLLTQSRGAWLALLLTLFLFYNHEIRTLWKKFFRNRLVSICSLIVIGTVVVISFMWLLNLNIESVKGRVFVWRVTWNMFREYPMLGIGFGRYPVEYLNFQAEFFDDRRHASFFDHAANMKQADSEYLQLLAETGVIGLFFTVLLVGYVCYRIRSLLLVRRKDRGMRLVIDGVCMPLVVVIFHSFVDNPLCNVAVGVIFTFMVALVSLNLKVRNLEKGVSFTFKNIFPYRIFSGLLVVYMVYNSVTLSRAYIRWREGLAYVKAHLLGRGIEKYHEALKDLPDEGELLFHIGSAYAYFNQPEKALPFLKRARLTFNDKNIYIAEGLCYYRLGDFSRSEESLLTALRMYPRLLLPRLWLAEMYLRTGRREEAIERLKEIIDIKPKQISDDVLVIKRDAERLLRRITCEID